jgi:hypothetical protein
LWDAARPLFAKSSQTKQIALIDERLESVGEVLEQHRINLSCLMESPIGIVEEAEDELSDIENLLENLVGVTV